MSSLTTITYATPNDLPYEMILPILCLCTSYAELLRLSMISKRWRMAYNSMRSTILAAVTKNIVGPDAFDNLVIVLRYQCYTTRNEYGMLVVDYPSAKAAMTERFVFNPKNCALVTKNQAYYQQALNNFKCSFSWRRRYDFKLSDNNLNQGIPMALFYEMWVAALRFGLESIADWSKREENKEPMINAKLIKYRLVAQCMLDGEFVAAPHWMAGLHAVYKESGCGNYFFDALLGAYGTEGHFIQMSKCSSHYTCLIVTGQNRSINLHNSREFYDFLHANPLDKVMEKYDLDHNWL